MKKINEELYVGSQISEGDVQLLKEHGIKTIVCNRPDNEGQGQTNIDAIRNEAKVRRRKYCFIELKAY